MKQGTINKADLRKLLLSAGESSTVYAPVRGENGVSLRELTADQQVDLDYSNFAISPKGLFFPKCEVLCRYKGEELVEAALPEGNTLVFGVRPCDSFALALLDKVFGEFGGTKDPYYLRRRENGLVISMGCVSPCETCFCTSVGGDPSGTRGADVSVTPVDDTLLFEAQTDRGESFMRDFADFFSEPRAADISAAEGAKKKAREKTAAMSFDGLKEKLDRGFDSPLWESISRVCLGCGLCTYQCPTCHCFDITDEKDGQDGTRIRAWDSCQYALFTHHASGHNPRPEKVQRMRQRILHKFQFTVDNFDEVFCVGCGRCVQNCPVNLDVREALRTLVKALP